MLLRKTRTARLERVLRIALILLMLPATGAAQLANPNPLALGWGGGSTAAARGFEAISTNPAGLAESSGFTLAVLATSLRWGLGPVDLGDLARWQDLDVPRNVREGWLERVLAEGSEAGTTGADLTLVSLSRGSLGFQLSTHASGTLDLNGDAAELLLFGNAGLTGEVRDFRLGGSQADGFLITTAALGYGLGVGQLGGGAVQVGGTLTYSLGHGLALARDNGSALRGDPLELDLRLPVLHVDGGTSARQGSGFGLHLGGLWTSERWSFGLSVRNALQTFEWELDGLVFRPGTALFDVANSESDFDSRPAVGAPPILLDAVDELRFRPSISLGASLSVSENLRVIGELRTRFGEGMVTGPGELAAVGAEYRPLPGVPIRLGVAAIEHGLQLSAGTAVALGRFSLAGAAALRTGQLADLVTASLALVFVGAGSE